MRAAAAETAMAMVFAQDFGRRKPSAAQPPSRSRFETSAMTKRIGTSLGRTRQTLWPSTMPAPAASSRALNGRARGCFSMLILAASDMGANLAQEARENRANGAGPRRIPASCSDMALDDRDRRILQLLQADAWLTYAAIAQRVH